MSKPELTTSCDKCGKVDTRTLQEAAPKGNNGNYVYAGWLPVKWALHNTEDGDGPEPDKVFVLCDDCEGKFQLSVREFKP